MKILKNHEKTKCGIKYPLFTIIRNQKSLNYCYYINIPWSSNAGDSLIFKSKTRLKLLNKYVLSFIGILYVVITIIIIYPLTIVLYPIYMYFDGLKNFVRNNAWAQNEKYFNWSNIVIIIGLIVWLILK
jgi:hypothetical protein